MPVSEPYAVSPFEIEQRVFKSQNRYESVMYWRKPVGDESSLATAIDTESRWVTWADTQPTKYVNQINKGWEPMPQFGRITSGSQTGGGPGAGWEKLLAHPKGPAAVPASQVIAFRWYKSSELPGSHQGRRIVFPQLVEAVKNGLKVQEHWCPVCNKRSFLAAWHLANHLTVAHGYQMDALIKLGEKMGVDFQRPIVREFTIEDISAHVEAEELSFDEAGDEAPLVVERVILKGLDTLPRGPELVMTDDEPVLRGEPIQAPVSMTAADRWAALQEYAREMGLDLPDQQVAAPRPAKPLSAAERERANRAIARAAKTPTGRSKRKLSPEQAERARQTLALARMVQAERRANAVPV